jgi:hypothetical protein
VTEVVGVFITFFVRRFERVGWRLFNLIVVDIGDYHGLV